VLCVFSIDVFVYRCNGEVELGSKALDDVLYRAQLELFPEALLVGVIIFVSSSISVCVTSTEHYVCVCVCVFVTSTVRYAALCWSLCGRVCVCVCQRQNVIPPDYLHPFHSAQLSSN